MPSFFTYTLGCKVNTYELESIKEQLLNKGYIQTSDVKDANYIIINTCCVTNTAQSKSRQKISSFRLQNPNVILIVMGCYVQGFEDELKEKYNVNLLVGTKDRKKIIEYIENLQLQEQVSLVVSAKENNVYENLEVNSYTENTRAFLKIQDGCNNFCSYCIIPYVRGQIKSRNKEDVLKEAKEFVNKGYKEIVLIGIHTGSYGKDLNSYTFSDLVEEIIQIEGLQRLRISSIEESEIDDKLIYLLVNSNKMAKHLHIPLQAGSDHVLKLMNRKYDQRTFVNKIKLIQSKVNDIAITTDIIVGFPQESDDDFKETINVSKEIGFSKIHVFPYSSRNNTVAAKMSGQIHGLTKKQRAKELSNLSDNLMLEFNRKYLNQTMEVLVETIDENNIATGHTSNFIKVKCKIDTNKVSSNDIIKVKILKLDKDAVIASWEE